MAKNLDTVEKTTNEVPVETDPVTVEVVEEVGSTKGAGFVQFMLKALSFWVIIAAIGLYLYTIYPPEALPVTPEQPVVSVQPTAVMKKVEQTIEKAEVIENEPTRFVPTLRQSGIPASNYKPLPPDQVQLIIDTFAPEQKTTE